jgi:hypothetical protein
MLLFICAQTTEEVEEAIKKGMPAERAVCSVTTAATTDADPFRSAIEDRGPCQ